MTKRSKKLFRSLPWFAWCQAGKTRTHEGFIAQPQLFPHRTSGAVICLKNRTNFIHKAQLEPARAGWAATFLTCQHSVSHLVPFLLKHFSIYSTEKQIWTGKPTLYNASRGPKYLKYPVKHFILVLKKIFFPTTFQNNEFWFQIRTNLLLKRHTQKC